MTKPVTGLTVFGSNTTGTTTQLDNNFAALQNALNDFNTYPNYLSASGSANAYSVTLPASTTGSKSDGLVIQVKINATNTGASVLNYNATGNSSIVNLDGTALGANQLAANSIVQLQYSSGLTSWMLQTPCASNSSVTVRVPVRQTVLSGPVDANGAANFGGSTGATTITMNGNLVVTAANGFNSTGASDYVGTVTNASWTGLSSNGNYYLYLQVASNGNVTTGNTTVAPVYQFGGNYSTTNNAHTFNIQEMVMKAGNGSAASAVTRVFAGEATVAANVVSAITWYALMGRYDGGYTQNLPAAGTAVTRAHNLGLMVGVIPMLTAQATTADAGYAIGAEITYLGTFQGGTTGPAAIQYNKTNVGFTNGSTGLLTQNASTGGLSTLTTASWKYKLTMTRMW